MQDADASDEQVETIAELKRKKEHLEKEVEKFGPKILSFFVEMHNQVATNLTEMEKIKTSLGERIENRQRDKVEKQRQIIDILKSFHF